MQTFLPFADFSKSAACLDDKRLGKQRVECLQILKALQSPARCEPCKGTGTLSFGWIRGVAQSMAQCPRCKASGYIPRAWANHPATRMWRGYEHTLTNYLEAVIEEWEFRGVEDTVWRRVNEEFRDIVNTAYSDCMYPHWLGDERLHSSHRAALLYKLPAHYSQFGWTETPKQDYYWPV